jgi:3-dehydroquinate dehydratase
MAPVFVSHVDWNINVPFVSYNDEKFVNELSKIKSSKKNVTFVDVDIFDKNDTVEYFKKKYRQSKLRNYVVTINIIKYFKNIGSKKRKKKVDKIHLIEHANSNNYQIEKIDSDRDKFILCNVLAKCFGLGGHVK